MKRDRGIGTATGTGWHRQRQGVRDSDKNSDRNLGTETYGQGQRERDSGTLSKICFKHLKMSPENMWNHLKNICRITILQLQRIWTVRNTINILPLCN